MKQFNSKRGAFVALALAIGASSASAQNPVRVRLNGRPFRTAVAPVSQNGRVLVPMRAIFEGLGATVDFNRADQSIIARRRGTVVRMTLGRRRAFVNDSPVRLDVTPVASLGRTLVPLRFVSEALGASVNYDSGRNLVSIDEGGNGLRRTERDRDDDGIPNRQDPLPDNPRNTSRDRDGDGVPNRDDAFPDDSTRR